MNFTAEEKLMYEAMKAIYDSGIPVSFKGSMVLKACLLEAGYTEETRHTVDIDANWNSDTSPTAEQLVESLIDHYCRRPQRAGVGAAQLNPAYDRRENGPLAMLPKVQKLLPAPCR